MILLLAIIAGLLAGLIRAQIGGQRLVSPNLRLIWLVPLAFAPQALAFYLPVTREVWADHRVAIGLVTSQLLLLVFAWFNLRQSGFWLLGLGLALNLLVIGLNGGLMPISPDMASRLFPETLPEAWEVGHRLGASKDIILPVAETRLWMLSDRFFLSFPVLYSYRVAFSLGDVLIAAGAFWLMWMMGATKQARGYLSGSSLVHIKN